jgi:antitoxin Phd
VRVRRLIKEADSDVLQPIACVDVGPSHIYDHYGHIGATAVKELQLKDAKATLSAVVDDAARGKPSIIMRHCKPEAIVLGMKDWERLSRVPSLARLLMAAPIETGDQPRRSRSTIRRFGG